MKKPRICINCKQREVTINQRGKPIQLCQQCSDQYNDQKLNEFLGSDLF